MIINITHQASNQKITDLAYIVQQHVPDDTHMNPGSNGWNHNVNKLSIKLHGYNPIKNKSKIH